MELRQSSRVFSRRPFRRARSSGKAVGAFTFECRVRCEDKRQRGWLRELSEAQLLPILPRPQTVCPTPGTRGSDIFSFSGRLFFLPGGRPGLPARHWSTGPTEGLQLGFVLVAPNGIASCDRSFPSTVYPKNRSQQWLKKKIAPWLSRPTCLGGVPFLDG